jgi:hypothetical protein
MPTDNRTSFTCPKCGMTSYHPKDVEHGYCGNCHDWTEDYLPLNYSGLDRSFDDSF